MKDEYKMWNKYYTLFKMKNKLNFLTKSKIYLCKQREFNSADLDLNISLIQL